MHDVFDVPVNGLPQHQAVISVEILWELENSSVGEVVVRLEGAVSQHLVLPLSQNQQAVTASGHNLRTHMTIVSIIQSVTDK